LPTPRPRPEHEFHYEGFASPNGTIVPDDVFDFLAPRLSEAELRVLLYIVRRTFGFGKNADAISLRQLTDGIVARDGRILDYGTGMSRKGVIGGIKGLITKGIISVRKATSGDGDNEVNVYSLRFREGVVTNGNYPGNRRTLPQGTQGNPQDSALQDSVRQQHTPPDGGLLNGRRGPVVAANADHTYGRPDLYETLRDLGVHQHTASKLLREHDPELIERMCEYAAKRLEQGWAPQESVAAWLVAAIRQRFDIPGHFQGRRERAVEQEREEEQREQALAAGRQADERAAEDLRRQRRSRLDALGIEQNVDEMWQETQARLRETGAWSLAMPLCFLKHVESGLAVVLVPAKVKGRLEGHLAALELALGQVTGQRVRVVLQELGERESGGWGGFEGR
jgi:hypothetical protein